MHRKSEESSHLGNRSNTHEFHEFQFHNFSPSNKFKTSILTLQWSVHAFTLHLPTLINMNKMMKSATLHSEVAIKLHEVKSTNMRCILTTNINICREENTTRRKKCQIFTSAMYSSYQAGVSPEGGLEVGQTL